MSEANKGIDMVVEATEFCKTNNITAGWSGVQHVKLVAQTLFNALGIESKEDKLEVYNILDQTYNQSAFRQTLERKGVLAKTEGGKRQSTDLASKYGNMEG